MSQLDDMITEYAKSCFGDINIWKDEKFKQQIKNLIMELIGDYQDNTDSKVPYPEYDDHISVGYNMKVDELRQKVSEL